MKKILSMLITLLLVLSIFSTGHSNVKASVRNYASISTDATKAYYVTDNGLIPLTSKELSEFNQGRRDYEQKMDNLTKLKNAQKNDLISGNNDNIVTPNDLMIYCYRYLQYGSNSERARYDLTRTICIPVFNETLDNSIRELNCSTSQSTTWEAGVTYTSGELGAIKNVLEASIGGSWQTTQSYSDTNKITIRPNYWGWFEFTPIMYNSWGYVETYDEISGVVYSRKWVDTYRPKYLYNGQLIGILVEKTSPTKDWAPIY